MRLTVTSTYDGNDGSQHTLRVCIMRYLFPARRCRLGGPFVLNGFRRVRYTRRTERNSSGREWLLLLLVISYFDWRFNIEKAVKNWRGKKENFENEQTNIRLGLRQTT